MGNNGENKEVVESQVFEISYSYNSFIGTYTYIKNYDEKYLEKVNYISHYNGKNGRTGYSTSGYAYFKAKKTGTTKIILGHEYRGAKKGNTSIKVKIKKNDGKAPIKNIEFQHRMPNKICLLGDAEVGKTSIINYLNGQGFYYIYEETINDSFIKKK